jgi:hypothetical protein
MEGPGGWVRDVNSVGYDAGEAIVLIDPLVADWAELDGVVAGRPVVVVLTAPRHLRSTDQLIARYGGELRDTASGVEVLPVGHEGERLLWLPGPRALVSAEALTGSADGLRVAESPVLRSCSSAAPPRSSARWSGRRGEGGVPRVAPAWVRDAVCLAARGRVSGRRLR